MSENNLELLRLEKGLTNRDFSELIGIGETSYSKLKKGSLPVGEKTRKRIADAFPGYNVDWILANKGPRFLTTTSTEGNSEVSFNRIPYYGREAYDAVNAGDNFSSLKPSLFVAIPGYADCDLAITALLGDEMAPEIKANDLLLCSNHKDQALKLYGKPYFLVIGRQLLFRRLQTNPKDGFVTLAADNDKYENLEVKLSQIDALYLIKGKVEVI